MKLYNTLTRQIEELKPLNLPTVTIYTCGPTVYDYPHIGNWFTFIRYELLIRSLKASELSPNWVLNITDVGHLVSDADDGEDKLEKGAKRENKTAWEIADFYTKYFINGMQRLNFLNPSQMPKATDHIEEQIDLIKQLEAKDLTYVIDDGVYYDTSKFPKYADFARLDLDEQQAGARVEVNQQKRNPSDFALWKFSPKDHKRDMEWDSPWGTGFPGWHIECSAMSFKYLGETLDIHCGGIDHVPVHHTNEIAQSEGASGKPFANLWMHTNHILINDEKIAKSAGNGILLEDIESAGYSLEAFRLHVLESHYRSQSKFSWDSIAGAENRLKGYYRAADLQFQAQPKVDSQLDESNQLDQIKQALQDDLDTPKALAILSNLLDKVEANLVQASEVESYKSLLKSIDDSLGTKLSERQDISPQQKALIADREASRTNKDWANSDRLRDELRGQGIELRDTEFGTIWSRL